MTSERQTWVCESCGHEHTPRCPSCRVVISGQEAGTHRCNTCGNPLSEAVYTCPECQTEHGLQPPKPEVQGSRRRGWAIFSLQFARFFTGLVQMIGLFTLGISCTVAVSGGASTEGPSPGFFVLAGLVMFLALMPVQMLIMKTLKRVSRGRVTIGERRRQS